MSVKKAYANLIEFLKVNEDKKVKTILDEVVTMCSAKSAGSSATTVHRDEAGIVTHIRCGYFKQWLPISHVEFGAKAGSASGFSPMSKEGTSLWSKQQREAKKSKEDLLQGVASGEVEASDLANRLEQIEETRTSTYSHPLGTDTVEEAIALTSADLDAMCEAEAAE